MKFYKLIVVGLTLLLALGPTRGMPLQAQEITECDQIIIVQADDWLSKIAEKVYGNVLAYPVIAEATNAMHSQDDTFPLIENLDQIEVGWQLCLPAADEAEALLDQPEVMLDTGASLSITSPNNVEVGRLILATTTSTDNSGLLEAILPEFEAGYKASVEVVAVGTGQAIQLGQNGDTDVILVHARAYEDAFVAEGHGLNRQDVMYNDFVIVGPATDPAGIQGMTDATVALTQIAQTNHPFISRGDDSGTHVKEQGLWQLTTWPLLESTSLKQTDKTQLKPEGNWYLSVGQGMGATLTVANEQQAYTLADRATFLARTLEGIDLEILVEGDSRLFNPYGVIAINPNKHADINAAGATTFIEWLTSVETQQRISQFGTDEFGMSLFVPNSDAWNNAVAQ